ncbi:N-acetylneuraminate synthase family protein [Amylibacter sp.]|nr:N-acetylneuraminate synthase family protein [Amylibacter sp.]
MYVNKLQMNEKQISNTDPTYFIADIAANHDGDLNRAIKLIHLAAEAGADCAKFQHFTAKTIVSKKGFSGDLGAVSHQSDWSASVFDVYDAYHTKKEWDDALVNACREVGIHFMTTPYNFEAIDRFKTVVPGFKLGSGDITYAEMIEKMAKTGLPIFLATGAADFKDVDLALQIASKHNRQICLMQCNTNYTGSLDNFKYVNLNVLKTFKIAYPEIILGLSDHTPGHSAVLGAVALGACVIEKHFTDDNSRVGPDHSFALNPKTWRSMVDATRQLELALGDGQKRVELNELETVIIQRRCLRVTKDLLAGHVIKSNDLSALRPAPSDSIAPTEIYKIIGTKLTAGIEEGDYLTWVNLKQ